LKFLTDNDHFAEQCCSDHSVIPGEATKTAIKELSVFEPQSNSLSTEFWNVYRKKSYQFS